VICKGATFLQHLWEYFYLNIKITPHLKKLTISSGTSSDPGRYNDTNFSPTQTGVTVSFNN
jgi:hypothetical protein